MLSHANAPLGARLWTFGTPAHVDSDGWEAITGTLASHPGGLAVMPEQGRAILVSPRQIAFRTDRFDRLVLGVAPSHEPPSIRLFGRPAPEARWQEIRLAGRERWMRGDAGIVVPLRATPSRIAYDQIRVDLMFATTLHAAPLDHIPLWPTAQASAR